MQLIAITRERAMLREPVILQVLPQPMQIHLVSITPNLSIFGTHSRISLLLMFFSFLCIFFLQLHHLDVSTLQVLGMFLNY